MNEREIMKRFYKSSWLAMAVMLATLTFGVRAYAETPREELVHSYRLLKNADHDYAGHREAAMKEIEVAGQKLGLTLGGDNDKVEAQWKSDKKLAEARHLLRSAHKKLEKKDREVAAAYVEGAIKEIDIALKIK